MKRPSWLSGNSVFHNAAGINGDERHFIGFIPPEKSSFLLSTYNFQQHVTNKQNALQLHGTEA